MKNQFANLNNNGASAHCVNNSEKSTQGVKTPCYKKWIASLIPFVRNDDLVCHYEGVARSNPTCLDCHDFLRSLAMTIKNKFANLNNNGASAHCVIQGVKTPCYSGYAFSYALKNQFEIISRNENYAFDYNKYFCRNGNNRIDDLFSRNDYGGKFIFGFWNNLNFGFLFNRKTKKK